jgi:DNA-binding transcriptional ArsR family regulator
MRYNTVMINAMLFAIADPRRREVLSLVQDAELSSGEIASHFAVTRPAISQHLRLLTEVGLVRVRRQGTRRLYSVRVEGMAELRAFLETFWEVSLNDLKQTAEAEERSLHEHDEPNR